ncbi:hypothetical protein AN1V17_26670 [Vallitalea sediminicola]
MDPILFSGRIAINSVVKSSTLEVKLHSISAILLSPIRIYSKLYDFILSDYHVLIHHINELIST